MKIMYRLKGDKKFSSEKKSEVIQYAKEKYNLNDRQVEHLQKFGTAQDGKIEINQFKLKLI